MSKVYKKDQWYLKQNKYNNMNYKIDPLLLFFQKYLKSYAAFEEIISVEEKKTANKNR